MGDSPLFEWRSGFPWSAVDEFQDFVGSRNQAGRLPSVSTLDFSLARPWRFRKYRFTAGLKVYKSSTPATNATFKPTSRRPTRKILQPDRALDRVRRVHEQTVT